MGKSTISMAIFHCYVSSPDGMPVFMVGKWCSTWTETGLKNHGLKIRMLKIVKDEIRMLPLFSHDST